MDLRKKCLDTYALVEIINGNPNFTYYLAKDFVITELTLIEFYGVLLREEGETIAEHWFKKLELYIVVAKREILLEAVRFKIQHRQQNISFFDAVGYVYSLRNNCVFVTGDKEFEHFKDVEFRK